MLDVGRKPKHPEVGVIFLVPDNWSDVWMGRNQIAARLAHYFPCLWVSPAHHWRSTWRRLMEGKRTISQAPGAPGLVVYRPEPWLPRLFGEGSMSMVLQHARVNRAKRALRRCGCRRFVLYVWRPEFGVPISSDAADLVCYHVADEYSFSDQDVPIAPHEAALIASADCVFVVSETLMSKKGGINPATFLVPNGVDFEAYSSASPEPPDLRAIPHPRVGYTGYLKKHLDWNLLATLAADHPEWSFVFVGPQSPHPSIEEPLSRLRQRSNAYFLGSKPTAALAAYPQHFDVCIMPYRDTGYTRYINPLKLNEYLAGGRPVVSTRIPAVESYDGVIRLASGEVEWSTAIREMLSSEMQSEKARSERQGVARQHDWNERVERIAQLMLDGFDRKQRLNSTESTEVS